MDTTVILEEPVFIKIEPVLEMIPDAEYMAEDLSSPVIKQELGSSLSASEEEGSQGMPEETQKLDGSTESSVANGTESFGTIEEHRTGCQQSEEQPLHPAWMHNGLESSSNTCNDSECVEDFSPRKKYSCDLCRKSFATPFTLRRHLQLHSNGLVMRNENFGTLPSNYGLNKHTEDTEPCCCTDLVNSCPHRTERLFSCSFCGKCFQKDRYLKQHLAYHSAEKAYICNECGLGFKCRKDILVHLNTHSNLRRHVCTVCGREFGRSDTLSRHVRSHSDDRQFICNDCGMAFKTRCDIINHLVRHSDARPFVCDVCGFAAKRRSVLIVHKESHNNDERYLCRVCGKSFKVKSNLNKHQLSHT